MQVKQQINLGQNNIPSIGLKNIQNACLKNILILDLSQNLICISGVKYLIKADLPSLTKLWISKLQLINSDKNKIGNEGIKHLSKGKWPNLNLLSISNNDIRKVIINQQSMGIFIWELVIGDC